MTFRPYPNPDRARHQLARHSKPALVDGLTALRSWSLTVQDAGANMAANLRRISLTPAPRTPEES